MWTTSQNGAGKQTQRGIRGIFIDFAENQKGYLFYSPASRQIYISGDITFDESFGSTIATTRCLNRDSLALRPAPSAIPDVNTTIEHTGEVIAPEDALPALIPAGVEEGELHSNNKHPLQATQDNNQTSNTIDAIDDAYDTCPALSPQTHDDSDSEADSDCSSTYSSDSDIDEFDDDDIIDFELPAVPVEEDISPQPANISRYGRVRRPNSRYAYRAHSYEWESETKGTEYQDLAHACATEATPGLPNSNDALSWEPAPKTIRDIVKMPPGTVREEWLKSVRKELKTLVDSGTFQEDTLREGETSTPVMETFKVKVKSDGSLDKLKTRLVVRGDLQDKNT